MFGCAITLQDYIDVAYLLDTFQTADGGEKTSHIVTHKGGLQPIKKICATKKCSEERREEGTRPKKHLH